MTVRTQQVYFPASFCLVLQIDFSQWYVSVVGSLEIDLWQVYRECGQPKKYKVDKSFDAYII